MKRWLQESDLANLLYSGDWLQQKLFVFDSEREPGKQKREIGRNGKNEDSQREENESHNTIGRV